MSAVLPPCPLQACRQNPPYDPINAYWLLFAIVGMCVTIALGTFFTVQVRGLCVRARVCVCVCVVLCVCCVLASQTTMYSI